MLTPTGSPGGSACRPNGRRRWRQHYPGLIARRCSPPSPGLCEGRLTCADTVRGGAGGGMTSLAATLGIASAVVLVGVLAVRASTRIGLPSLLLYLGIGVLLGEAVFGIPFSDARLTESLGLAAL